MHIHDILYYNVILMYCTYTCILYSTMLVITFIIEILHIDCDCVFVHVQVYMYNVLHVDVQTSILHVCSSQYPMIRV